MGIKGLMKLLSDECPRAIKEHELNNLTGRKVAIDASMVMYQFLVAVRASGEGGYPGMQLTNEAGEVTSHVQGMFNRSIKMMTAGIKPVFVFDGKPPDMKGGELEKRTARRDLAQAELEKAKESGDAEDVDKFSKRLVKVGKRENDDCKELLRLMGIPVVEAPCEAEAQCAELARQGKVFATATEDMDALTFRTPKLLRKLTFSQEKDKKQPILEIDFDLVLSGLELTYDQFVDLCIMMGCDYCGTIKGIGPKTAFKLIKQHGSLEAVIAALRKEKKYQIPDDWRRRRVPKVREEAVKEETETVKEENVDANGDDIADADADADVKADAGAGAGAGAAVAATEAAEGDGKPAEDTADATEEGAGADAEAEAAAAGAGAAVVGDYEDAEGDEPEDSEFEIIEPLYRRARFLFHTPDVTPAAELALKWDPPDEVNLRIYLVEKMGFNAERVDSGIKRLLETQKKTAQARMDR
jgi:flap endonuclease-1